MYCNDQVTGGDDLRACTFYKFREGFTFEDSQPLDACEWIADGCHWDMDGDPTTGYVLRGVYYE